MTTAASRSVPRRLDSRPPAGFRLSPRARKGAVIAHVVSSVGWLGLMLCLLTLGLAGLLTDRAETLRSAYRVLPLLGDALVLPLSLASLLTGLVLSLGTPWGLFRYHWVTVKFWLTLAATAASAFALTARLHEAARLVERHPTGGIAELHLGSTRYELVIIPAVALSVYLAEVVISVAKPWGRRRSRRGRPTG
ncbi:hypothetical protein CFP65_4695 [Kitasatospora sp. MMS16-BH015]|uniref:DUF2269 domain-containing protein n=1 Tax=Kitasatospora sp. MMS16-BH015 TaxID=2018025 RepID=UPI000CA13DCA|nr:DUF2269 domain-containing protein [Kitasatospora sp. MMS16-BH015]AUG79423.1 hypothetical protein CFP65_4695 [Kitasatospora sp. MMS16-BH015]